MTKRFIPSQTFKASDITDESVFKSRRHILKSMGYVGASGLLSGGVQARGWFDDDEKVVTQTKPLEFTQSQKWSTDETQTPYAKVTSYNNFYEFGTGKDDPAERAKHFKVDPWTLTIDGMVNNPITLGYDDILNKFPLEERVYRLRCVEAWSMVIPWLGFELNNLIKLADPQGSAKYVAFETLDDPKQMPGIRNPFIGGGIDYPYVEGLRLDEALHPLT
ncbi:MAG: protein-methionine-sulfoxide reductase catalytic subunit MsrP, partial [Alteromonadaceae bacterium]|nr:protein-methionine-sulfoxide reductase catalytic subunit MsrP [Alteromonadaceae bacterium]